MARSQPHKTPEQKRLNEVVIDAKGLLTYPDINWEDWCWDITAYEKPKAHRKRPDRLYFTIRRSSKSDIHISYEPPFADFAKAIIRVRASDRGLSFHGHTHMIIAQRYLYDALKQTGTADPTKLNRKTFAVAMSSAKSRAKGWTIYHVGRALQEISEWIDERELACAEINFLNPIPSLGKGDGLDPESQALGLLKLPSAGALDALADISNEPADDDERIIMRIVDLLVVGGFRIGEVLSLPLDCWTETPALNQLGKVITDPRTGNQVMRHGIRYWPEKGGDPYVKWLADCAMPLAQRAVTDLKRLCADARRVARTLEENPDRVQLPGTHSPDDLLGHQELKSLFGLRTVECVRLFLAGIGVRAFSDNKPNGRYAFRYRIDDIERALLKRRATLVIARRPGGQVQMLSESLCVMFRKQFHAAHSTLKFLPELIGEGQINNALGNDADQVSIFSLRGLSEPDGSRMRIKSSAFRHWLNTLLSRGGLSDIELARWSGRRNIDQNAAYKHGTVEQRVSWARNMIKEGTLRGPAADTYNSINDPVEKEQFLETFVNVALFTPYGVCIHDYAIDPCPYHLNCLGGCSEYLRTKGDKDEREAIEEVRGFHLVQLQRLKSATQNDAGPVRNYEAHCERIVQGATAALAVDEDNIPDGQHVKVFPKGSVRGKAVTSL
jgi:hypothetical protein